MFVSSTKNNKARLCVGGVGWGGGGGGGAGKALGRLNENTGLSDAGPCMLV